MSTLSAISPHSSNVASHVLLKLLGVHTNYIGPDGKKILIVLLPKFAQEGSVVLVNTLDLSCECIKIDCIQ